MPGCHQESSEFQLLTAKWIPCGSLTSAQALLGRAQPFRLCLSSPTDRFVSRSPPLALARA